MIVSAALRAGFACGPAGFAKLVEFFQSGRVEILDREIMSRFDHRDLNVDTPFFDKAPPTPENLVLAIRRQLAAVLPQGLLASIRLEEDAETFVEWFEDGSGA